MAKSKPKVPMPASMRAKQFAPFQALNGLYEALAEREKQVVPRKELSEEMIEELNRKLCSLEKGQIVTIVYYGMYEQNYKQLTGQIEKIDTYWKSVQLGNVQIHFSEISDILAL